MVGTSLSVVLLCAVPPAPPASAACLIALFTPPFVFFSFRSSLQVRNLQRMQARTEVTTDREVIAAFREIGKICAAMKLLDTVKKQAEEFYKQVCLREAFWKEAVELLEQVCCG